MEGINVDDDVLEKVHDSADIPIQRQMEKALHWLPRGIKKLPKPSVDLFQLKKSFYMVSWYHRDWIVVLPIPNFKAYHISSCSFVLRNMWFPNHFTRTWSYSAGQNPFIEYDRIHWSSFGEGEDHDVGILLHRTEVIVERGPRVVEYIIRRSGMPMDRIYTMEKSLNSITYF